MIISCPAFTTGSPIPMRHTQEAEDTSPEILFSNVPSSAKSLVLIADDPDAPDPDAPKTIWLHWLIINLPPSTESLAEGVKILPSGARTTINDSGDLGWSGPRPPIGTHRYFFHLFALDTTLELPPQFTRAQVEEAMEGHVVAQAHTFGTYRLSTNP